MTVYTKRPLHDGPNIRKEKKIVTKMIEIYQDGSLIFITVLTVFIPVGSGRTVFLCMHFDRFVRLFKYNRNKNELDH